VRKLPNEPIRLNGSQISDLGWKSTATLRLAASAVIYAPALKRKLRNEANVEQKQPGRR
jgi:hypothetical protein